MRLFTAINFHQDRKDNLYQVVELLKKMTTGGSFTAKDNLHLTLNFIGETKRIELIQEAMQEAVESTKAESFYLSIGGIGRFKRREGDIYWIGVEKENTLWKLQKELTIRLKEAGFYDIDAREYKPHLTLARRVKVGDFYDKSLIEKAISSMRIKVDKISLMKSERIQGKLVYTEIFQVGLK
ncbi:RNA 2',3'-cyclic phosphodiesterase [Mobilitalea sibirica]|uniref:RNA 2',3'-cyclic phosphodiesterase n=1 Tax=Mobilitalea sibirica TaxID=1462919 RepID=A0A8J7KSL3_9FIRM|nr:RNA 2',3'-cyclic phosphodiesterase [Mobilitalea sibirica]MBH1940401.1 RNA 2',3'-cyclic phosphodiesterase [Mobilitalea sibirica]